ncbi:lysozyme inhibitor LprI family protein [Franconibacter helveticus 513]|uniref:lysozyme inhibitor LprI family protein n=1 Tax=Franconibacter helveticus TaxID=357240 RepID=UPI00042462BD|nr:lysozyme inhibitor LprI family protein [Franconibacter helveticus]MDU6924603.1 lysozyme inhibitor LprI family protein [Franconibacter helveticus]
MKARLIAFSLLLGSSAAWSMSCENPRSAYDITYCAALEMVQSDRDLNQQYKNTMDALTPAQKPIVKKAQIAWLKTRDQACAEGSTLLLGCVNEKMASRIALLKSIERECRNAGCDNANLSRVE